MCEREELGDGVVPRLIPIYRYINIDVCMGELRLYISYTCIYHRYIYISVYTYIGFGNREDAYVQHCWTHELAATSTGVHHSMSLVALVCSSQ